MSERNVLGEALEPCGTEPLTGFYRDGCCSTGPEDLGSHTICAVVTSEFLTHQKGIGNDLSTPMPQFRFPQSTLAYFPFVFAGITPLLFLGSVIGRINFKVWLIFVPLWSTLAYSVNAFLLWGGGWWAQRGSLDYSGGYVIHLALANAASR